MSRSRDDADSRRRGAVIVTGASSGIGHAGTLALAARGYHVFPTVRRIGESEALFPNAEGRISPVQMDVTDAAGVDAAVERIGARLSEERLALIGLVSNAGAGMMVPVEFLYEDVLRHQLETNLIGHVTVARRLLPLIREAAKRADAPQRGRILFVGTGAGVPSPVYPFLGAYMACKWGLEAICRSLRQELALHGDPIDVGMVNPGFVRTRMSETTRSAVATVFARLPEQARARYAPLLARFGQHAAHQRGSDTGAAAAVLVRAMSTPRARRQYHIGRDSIAAACFARLPLALQEHLIARIYRGRQGP
ncbi:MAG: SDR family NAD(P)-dependent oxidoreductase [Gammaproteobacteria bacterium]|nr:SDR family NAD(P)-dependent oxidoreductase [Gammaproteobacteria bacterium]